MIQKVLEKLATNLERKNFEYMLIGGQAVLLYGEPRLTKDIDITLSADIDRLNEVISMVEELGWTILVKDPYEFVKKTMVLPIKASEMNIRVDLIFSYTPYERGAIKRAKKVKIGNAFISFASPEDIIIHKLISGRPRDIEDIRGILLKKGGALDTEYIFYWLRQFEETLKKPVIREFQDLLKEVT